MIAFRGSAGSLERSGHSCTWYGRGTKAQYSQASAKRRMALEVPPHLIARPFTQPALAEDLSS
jgi:hypothetical protein